MASWEGVGIPSPPPSIRNDGGIIHVEEPITASPSQSVVDGTSSYGGLDSEESILVDRAMRVVSTRLVTKRSVLLRPVDVAVQIKMEVSETEWRFILKGPVDVTIDGFKRTHLMKLIKSSFERVITNHKWFQSKGKKYRDISPEAINGLHIYGLAFEPRERFIAPNAPIQPTAGAPSVTSPIANSTPNSSNADRRGAPCRSIARKSCQRARARVPATARRRARGSR